MVLTIVGSGYVGTALARQLQLQRQAVPLVLTTTSELRLCELNQLADRVQICDATNPDHLRKALNKSRVAVFTLGPKGNRQGDVDLYRSTFEECFHCLSSVIAELPALQHIVYTSSCSVYGHASDAWVNENTPARPRTARGEVLLESEQLVMQLMGENRKVCVLRLAALYGPGREIKDRLRGLAGKQLPGDGGSFSNWVHVDDAAGAALAAINGCWTGLVNVVNDEPLRDRDLVDRTLIQEGLERVQWTGAPGPAPPFSRCISNHRLKELGYRLQHPTLFS